MGDRCEQDIFDKGHSIAILDACRHRAEMFAQALAKESGQRVDWHYTAGRANVLYLGEHAKVAAALPVAFGVLTGPMVRREGECGSCSGHEPEAHGPYRAGDPLPHPHAIAVGSMGEVFVADGRRACDPDPRYPGEARRGR